MKVSDLRQIIKEEIRKVIAENNEVRVIFRDKRGTLSGGRFKRQANGKWVEVSSNAMAPHLHGIERLLGKTKKEHQEIFNKLKAYNDSYSKDQKKIHKIMIDTLTDHNPTDKELTDADLKALKVNPIKLSEL